MLLASGWEMAIFTGEFALFTPLIPAVCSIEPGYSACHNRATLDD
jgi:hypothetical protein